MMTAKALARYLLTIKRRYLYAAIRVGTCGINSAYIALVRHAFGEAETTRVLERRASVFKSRAGA